MRLPDVIWSFAIASTLLACGPRPVADRDDLPPPPSLEDRPPPQESLDLPAAVAAIPPGASKALTDELVGRLLVAVLQARSADLPQVAAALADVRDQPQIVASLIDHYEALPEGDHAQRLMTLGLIGELQRPDTLPFFHKLIWAPLPHDPPRDEELTTRDYEEMMRVKALHGLAYLRTPEAARAVVDIMLRHESTAVRIAAVDSYMWNHGDSQMAAEELYKILPTEFHKFVQRPRFHRGMDPTRFNEQLQAWQKRWGAPPREP